ncbi:MAG: F-box protein [Candidatus Paracaedibacteraceae bacterium]|nr:F-box protein [Candidatus Paracaedibacteraceae bacterium]
MSYFKFISAFVFLFNVEAADDFLAPSTSSKRQSNSDLDEIAPAAKRFCPPPVPEKRPAHYVYVDEQDDKVPTLRPRILGRHLAIQGHHILDLPHDIYRHIFANITYDEYLSMRFVNQRFYTLIDDPHFAALFIPKATQTLNFWQSYHHGNEALQKFFTADRNPILPLSFISTRNLVGLLSLRKCQDGFWDVFCSSDRFAILIPYLPRIISLISHNVLYYQEINRALEELKDFSEHDIEKVTCYMADLNFRLTVPVIQRLRFVDRAMIPNYKKLLQYLAPLRKMRPLPSDLILQILDIDYPSFEDIYNGGLKKLYTPGMSTNERLTILDGAMMVNPAMLEDIARSVYVNRGSLFLPNNDRAVIIKVLLTLTPQTINAIGAFFKNCPIPKKSQSAHIDVIRALSTMTPERINVLRQHFPEFYGKQIEYLRASMLTHYSFSQFFRAESSTADCLHWLLSSLGEMPHYYMEVFLKSKPFIAELPIYDRIRIVSNVTNLINRQTNSYAYMADSLN